jgi:hypothetical protein
MNLETSGAKDIQNIEKSNKTISCSDCSVYNKNIEDLHFLAKNDHSNDGHESTKYKFDSSENKSLLSINLSGCWSITDYGLR